MSCHVNIDGADLQWQTELKFLGMILDERLNWNSHIDYVSGRCQKRINLMRGLSGTNWGANKRSLLHIYKATIRSVLEYGSAAFNSATPTVKAKLDKIQAQALRIACGATKSTSIASLQGECGEMPLQIRRNEIALKYSIKVKNDPKHPAKKIIEETGLIFKRKQYTFQKERNF